jgi:hypothetical protein
MLIHTRTQDALCCRGAIFSKEDVVDTRSTQERVGFLWFCNHNHKAMRWVHVQALLHLWELLVVVDANGSAFPRRERRVDGVARWREQHSAVRVREVEQRAHRQHDEGTNPHHGKLHVSKLCTNPTEVWAGRHVCDVHQHAACARMRNEERLKQTGTMHVDAHERARAAVDQVHRSLSNERVACLLAACMSCIDREATVRRGRVAHRRQTASAKIKHARHWVGTHCAHRTRGCWYRVSVPESLAQNLESKS